MWVYTQWLHKYDPKLPAALCTTNTWPHFRLRDITVTLQRPPFDEIARIVYGDFTKLAEVFTASYSLQKSRYHRAICATLK